MTDKKVFLVKERFFSSGDEILDNIENGLIVELTPEELFTENEYDEMICLREEIHREKNFLTKTDYKKKIERMIELQTKLLNLLKKLEKVK